MFAAESNVNLFKILMDCVKCCIYTHDIKQHDVARIDGITVIYNIWLSSSLSFEPLKTRNRSFKHLIKASIPFIKAENARYFWMQQFDNEWLK